MKSELHNFDIFPKVFLVNENIKITIMGLGKHVTFKGNYVLKVVSMMHGNPRIYSKRNNVYTYEVLADEKGRLMFNHKFDEESEYLVEIVKDDTLIVALSVFALEKDMRGRYPYRGDFHVHTCRSDGKQAPSIVVANYRKQGYDFIAITDHHRYFPSLEAIEDYQNVPHEMNIVCGEEVHVIGTDIHIVNFGGEYSVNCILEPFERLPGNNRRAIIDNPPSVITEQKYIEEVNEIISKYDIPDGIEKFSFAACVWVCEHIRKGNGLSIFAHPYWKPQKYSPYHVPYNLSEYITENGPFDAFEVLGGCAGIPGTNIQSTKYYADREKGIHYPAIGCTDSHDSIAEENENAYIAYTMVFSKENERKELIDSVKSEYCVAVNPLGYDYRMVGSTRLVNYTSFLLSDFMPLHDELCFEEGRLMKLYVTGDESATDGLTYVYGRMKRLYEKYFSL